MTTLNSKSYPPYRQPLFLDMPQAPAHVWAHLNFAQQQEVYQTLAQVCRQLAHQIKRRERPHDHR